MSYFVPWVNGKIRQDLVSNLIDQQANHDYYECGRWYLNLPEVVDVLRRLWQRIWLVSMSKLICLFHYGLSVGVKPLSHASFLFLPNRLNYDRLRGQSGLDSPRDEEGRPPSTFQKLIWSLSPPLAPPSPLFPKLSSLFVPIGIPLWLQFGLDNADL